MCLNVMYYLNVFVNVRQLVKHTISALYTLKVDDEVSFALFFTEQQVTLNKLQGPWC